VINRAERGFGWRKFSVAAEVPTTASGRKASEASTSSIPTTTAYKSPPTRPIIAKNCFPTKKSGGASSPAAKSKAASWAAGSRPGRSWC